MSSRQKILLVGPKTGQSGGSFGGGMGGPVRNMQIFLNSFESDEFDIVPCFNSIRRQTDLPYLSFPSRFLLDTARVFQLSRDVAGVHFFGQYRFAVYREYAQTRVCLSKGIPYTYQIRAGAFINWFESCTAIERAMMKSILGGARLVLCEGQPYVEYLHRALGIDSYHFPNFIDSNELPSTVPTRLLDPTIRVLFCGFCYEGKGVFDLVEGCRLAATRGTSVDLTLAGAEDAAFSEWLDAAEPPPERLRINRLGLISHEEVMEACTRNDVFALLSRHPGEGHSNAINEAMSHGQVIICTRHGFLESVLGEDAAFYVDPCTPEKTAEILARVSEHRDDARKRATAARQRLEERFTSQVAFATLENYYRELVSG